MRYLLGAVAGVVVAVVVVWLLFFQTGLRIDLSRPAVVQRIQRLQRLETVVYSMEKIVTGTQDNAYLPKFLGGDRILLIVHGEVVAGIDLGKLDETQIDIKGRNIEIELPPAEVFSTRIDNERTKCTAARTACSRRRIPTSNPRCGAKPSDRSGKPRSMAASSRPPTITPAPTCRDC